MKSKGNPQDVRIVSDNASTKRESNNNEYEGISQSSNESSHLNCIMLWNNDETTWDSICDTNYSDR